MSPRELRGGRRKGQYQKIKSKLIRKGKSSGIAKRIASGTTYKTIKRKKEKILRKRR